MKLRIDNVLKQLAENIGINIEGVHINISGSHINGQPHQSTITRKDSGNVVSRAAVPQEPPNPLKTAETDTVHVQAVQKAAEDVTAGRPVELPPEAFMASGAAIYGLSRDFMERSLVAESATLPYRTPPQIERK